MADEHISDNYSFPADAGDERGRPEAVIAFAAAAVSGLAMGLMLGWLLWRR